MSVILTLELGSADYYSVKTLSAKNIRYKVEMLKKITSLIKYILSYLCIINLDHIQDLFQKLKTHTYQC